ncbi:MAG: hypothetical protein CR995_00175 [Clostridiales bacterium]|nr:MAG: hypothetical protein CR995_00175 [Clostridiales bacterium]
MMRIVVGSVIAGIIAGLYLLPPVWQNATDSVLTIGLCLLLFFVGVDIGREGKALENLKAAGFRILLLPVAVVLGSYAGALLASLMLPVSALESILISSGFGWYSLAPIMIAEKSAELSAIAFLHNVFRESFGIILIPFVAQYIGFVETISLPGAAAMDVCLPIVEKSTNGTIAIYSFISGLLISIFVPISVGFLLQIL